MDFKPVVRHGIFLMHFAISLIGPCFNGPNMEYTNRIKIFSRLNIWLPGAEIYDLNGSFWGTSSGVYCLNG